MPDPIITNNETSGLIVWEPVYEHGQTLIDATGGTYEKGTVLGRITASGNLTAYTSGATDGSEVPIMVLPYEQVLAAATAVTASPLISGQVRRGDLIARGVGALTQAEVDALRDFTIIARPVTQLAEQDNQ